MMGVVRQVGTMASALVLAAALIACSGGDSIGDVQWIVRFSAVQPASTSVSPGASPALQIRVAVDRIASGEREPAPDGTLVEFGSTGGQFESGTATQQAWTSGGVALAVLGVTSPASYDITARVRDTEGILHVDVSEAGTATVR